MRLTEKEFEQMFGKTPKRQKYGNKKCEWRGIVFDSIRERDRFIILDSEQREGKITDLNRQVHFQLLPVQKVNGKIVERPCGYIADFVYRRDGELVVEDVKSTATKTKEYRIKRKMMLWFHGIQIREV